MKLGLQRLRRNNRSQVQKLIRLADRNRDEREWNTARQLYAEALSLDRSLAHIWVQYGHALKEGGGLSEALSAYHTALKLQDDNADTALQIGHCVKLMGNTNEAITWYLRALELDAREINAEKELRFLGVSVEDHFPDFEKRRAFTVQHSLTNRPVFFCLPRREIADGSIISFKAGLFQKHMAELAGQEAAFRTFEICADGAWVLTQGRLKDNDARLPQSRTPLPKGSAVIISLDIWLRNPDMSSIVLELVKDLDVFPILFVDKNVDRFTAEEFIRNSRESYLNARLISAITLAIDCRTVATLDGVASIEKQPLSEVLALELPSFAEDHCSAGAGKVVIVARNFGSAKLKSVVRSLRENTGNITNGIVLIEEAAVCTPADDISWLPAYSEEAISVLENSRLVIVVDDCVDSATWVLLAKRWRRPVVCGILESNFRIWGGAILDYVDFSNPGSLTRVWSHARLNEKCSDSSPLGLGCVDFGKWILATLSKYSQHTWIVRSGFPKLRFGQFYSFAALGNEICQGSGHWGGRFRYGQMWPSDKQDVTSPVRAMQLAMQVDLTVGRLVRVMVLFANEHKSERAHISWNARGGSVEKVLLPGQSMWVDTYEPVQDESGNLITGVRVSGCLKSCTLLGFLAFPAEDEAPWFSFLEQLSRGAYHGLLARISG